MEYQKLFIEIISRYLPEGTKLVDFISDLICLGKEASYRRMRCEVEFTLSEVVTIAKKLNINLTSLIIREGGDKVVFNLRFIEEANSVQSYLKKIEANLNIMEGFQTAHEECTFYNVSTSIPDVFTYGLPYLTKLQLLKIQFDSNKMHTTPIRDIIIPDVIYNTQKQYWKRISDFRLVFILEPNILLSAVSDILFFYELNLITDDDRKQLKEELMRILDIINDAARTGEHKGKAVSLYVSHVIFNLSHSFIKAKGLDASIVELYMPNSLLSFDYRMCETHFNRINMIKKYSSLISQSGEINKITFLNSQRRIIEQL